MTLNRYPMASGIIVMCVLLSLIIPLAAGSSSASVRITGILLPRQPPVAQFTASVTNGPVPLTVQFTDTSTNSPTAWNWSFGDGNYATVQNPVYTYTSTGTFTVSLTVSNAIGSDTATQYITVTQSGGGGGGGGGGSEGNGPAVAPPVFQPPVAPPVGNPGATVSGAFESYPIGFPGLIFNADGSDNLSLDLAAARAAGANVTWYLDRLEIYQHHSPGVTITFWGNTFVNHDNIITGPVSHAEFVTDPMNASFALGNISASVHSVLPALTEATRMNNTLSANVSTDTISRFGDILSRNNLGLNSVAYTLDINKVKLTTGPSNITLTIPASWVNLHGGTDAVHITRISEETGQMELLTTTYLGLDAQGNMIFRGDSPNGTSLFGLVTAEVTAAEETEHPNVTYVGVSKSSMVTNEGMYSWALGIILANPIVLVPIAAIIAVFAYFMWWKRRL
jgi:PKD repeat protein